MIWSTHHARALCRGPVPLKVGILQQAVRNSNESKLLGLSERRPVDVTVVAGDIDALNQTRSVELAHEITPDALLQSANSPYGNTDAVLAPTGIN